MPSSRHTARAKPTLPAFASIHSPWPARPLQASTMPPPAPLPSPSGRPTSPHQRHYPPARPRRWTAAVCPSRTTRSSSSPSGPTSGATATSPAAPTSSPPSSAGSAGRTTASGDVEARIRALRRRFREADAALCDGTGGPAPGHDLRMYALSLEVWGVTAAVVAPPRPDPVPDKDAASTAVGNKKPFTPAPRAAAAPAPAKKRRCEEYPALAREAERLTREALERIDDVTAWSLEMRASKKEQRLLERMRKQYRQQQQRAGGVPADRRAEDGSKELASVMVKLIRGGHGPSSAGSLQR
ncbi:hypothetical protein ZWY2020_045246 [Hordeum vulgare]|nr:hypothetical protein ZWY2020_045246 [Hordeum vulgare]